jgi:hypothetical protein
VYSLAVLYQGTVQETRYTKDEDSDALIETSCLTAEEGQLAFMHGTIL